MERKFLFKIIFLISNQIKNLLKMTVHSERKKHTKNANGKTNHF